MINWFVFGTGLCIHGNQQKKALSKVTIENAKVNVRNTKLAKSSSECCYKHRIGMTYVIDIASLEASVPQ